MAPFNLSDFAVKEIKIPTPHLVPAKTGNYLGKFLAAHFLDFWALVWINATATFLFKSTLGSFMSTRELTQAWDAVNFSAATGFTFMAFSFAYFFTCYYMNHGQTPGMKVMKCRVRVKEHNFSESMRWTLKSFATYATLGLVSQRFASSVVPQDHLWHELVTLKEVAAPDVRSLITTTEKEEEFARAA